MSMVAIREGAQPATVANYGIWWVDSSGNPRFLSGAGVASVLARLNVANTFTANVTVDGMVSTNHVRTRIDTVNDDAAINFALNQNIGCALISASISGSVNSVLLAYRAAVSPHCTILAGGSNVTTGTSALSGTTGTDGKLNIAVDTSGNFYIENRTGFNQSVRVVFLA